MECKQGERCNVSIYRFCVVFCSISRMPRRHIHFSSDFCVFTFSIVFICFGTQSSCVWVWLRQKYIACWILFHLSVENGRRPKTQVRFLAFSPFSSSVASAPMLAIDENWNGFSFFHFFRCGQPMLPNLNPATVRQIAHIKLNLLRNIIGCWLLTNTSPALRQLSTIFELLQFHHWVYFFFWAGCSSTQWFDSKSMTMMHCFAFQMNQLNHSNMCHHFRCNDWWIINFLTMFFFRQSHVIFHH